MRKRREAMGISKTSMCSGIKVRPGATHATCVQSHSKGTVASDSKPAELKQAELPAFYLSVLKISNWTFHSPFADFFQHTTYFPFVVVGLFCASFIFNSNVPAS